MSAKLRPRHDNQAALAHEVDHREPRRSHHPSHLHRARHQVGPRREGSRPVTVSVLIPGKFLQTSEEALVLFSIAPQDDTGALRLHNKLAGEARYRLVSARVVGLVVLVETLVDTRIPIVDVSMHAYGLHDVA